MKKVKLEFPIKNKIKKNNEIRLEGIIRKAIQNNCDLKTLALTIAKDSYFEEIKYNLGSQQADKAFQEIIEKAIAQEIDFNFLSVSDLSCLYSLFQEAFQMAEKQKIK